jgi:hypothetical protein
MVLEAVAVRRALTKLKVEATLMFLVLTGFLEM